MSGVIKGALGIVDRLICGMLCSLVYLSNPDPLLRAAKWNS